MSDIENVKAEFSEFLENNAAATLKDLFEEDGETHAGYLLLHPWDDPTLGIEIPKDSEKRAELVVTLNSVSLPKQLSAIHHTEENRLEVIWTANKLNPIASGAKGRSFTFNFQGKAHKCTFAPSSDTLLNLLSHTRPVSNPNHTNHRNVVSFVMHLNSGGEHRGAGDPLSFFIEDFEFSDDEGVSFLRCLNFYMSYYDHSTPLVLIHEDSDMETAERHRYLHGKFPAEINGSAIDDNLLGFWNASLLMPDMFTKFLYCFRILEYSAKSYLDHSMNMALKRALCTPHASSDLGKLTSEIIAVFSQKSMDDYAKLDALVNETVNVDLIWAEVEKNLDYFSKPHTFDGGLTMKPLVSKDCTPDSFKSSFPGHLLKGIRELRNGIAHGKEVKSSATVLPSLPNKVKLRPWLNIIELLAGEVILFREHV